MHRNAEIWAQRHNTVTAIGAARRAIVQAALAIAPAQERVTIRTQHDRWEARYARIEARVFNAWCVAKCWRKA